MNQSNRSVPKKCINCGRTIWVPQVYDKHYSVYVDARPPICYYCDSYIGLPVFDIPKQDQKDDRVISS